MNFGLKYRLFFSLLLALVFTTSLATQSMHLLLEHRHEVRQPSCDIGDDVAHLHSEEYAHQPCHLCIYKISQFQEENPEPETLLPPVEGEVKPEVRHPFRSLTSLIVRQQRAPPVRS